MSRIFLKNRAKAIRSFQIPTNSHSENINVDLSQPDIEADNLPLETWASSWVMASQLHLLPIQPPSPTTTAVPILELGAGTGLVGITAASVWRAPVVLTDLAPIVPGLAANISLNEDLLAASESSATCGTLDWTRPSELLLESGERIAAGRRADIILAADTVYSEEHPELLVAVVLAWLARHAEARFVITYAMRVAYLDEIREVWERLEAGGLEAVAEGQGRAGEDEFDDECLCEWSVWKWKTVPI